MPPPTDAQIALIRRFEPILFFHAQERFFPSDAKRYLEHCVLTVGAAPVIAAGKVAALASEAGAPADYLGRKLATGKFEFLEETAANPGNKDAFFDLAGWMPPTPQLPEPKRYANLNAIAARYADAADPLNASQFWYHAEFFDRARLETLFADEVAKGGKPLGTLFDTPENDGAFETPALICYYLFFPGHDEGLPGCETVPSAKEFASFAGEWACFALLLDAPGPNGPFLPRYAGLSMRNVGVADHLGEEVRVGMRIFPWEALRAQALNEHPRLLVAQGNHSLYLPSETPGTVKAFTPDDPGRNSCGLAEPVAAAMDGTDDITAPPFLLPPSEDITRAVKVMSAMAGGALIGLIGGPIGAAIGAAVGGIVGGIWLAAESPPFKAGSGSSPSPGPTPGPVTDTVPPTAAGPTAGKVVHPIGTVPPEASGGRGQPWRSDKLDLGNRRYDYLVDRDAQIFWAGDPALPGYPGRWGPPVEADPQPRRAGMRFPKFWRMFFSELVLAPPKFVTVDLPAGKKADGSEANTPTRTFTAFDFGPPAPQRQIFAGVAMNGISGAPHLSSATIGGVAATIVSQALNANPASGVYLIAADVPNGATGDIVLTFDAAVSGVGVCIWIVSGASLAAASASSDVDASDPQTGFVNCPDGGAAFGIQGIPSGFAGATVWSGVTGNAHAQFAAGSNRWAAGVAQAFPLAQSFLSVSADPGNGALSNPTAAWIGVKPA